MDILSNFGETLSELMLLENLSAVDLAKNVNIDRSNISRYLERKTMPTLPYAIEIADYFGCSLDYLFGLTNEFKKREYLSCPPFYQAFQGILKLHNCTQYRLTKDLGIVHQSLNAWYRGKHLPSMDSIIRIAKYLGCSLDEFVGRKVADCSM